MILKANCLYEGKIPPCKGETGLPTRKLGKFPLVKADCLYEGIFPRCPPVKANKACRLENWKEFPL